jgi:hypothetical protein
MALRVQFKPFKNPAGTMLGWLNLYLPSGLVINDAKLMVGPQGKRWVALLAVPQVHADGSPRLVDGKKAWRQIVEFQSDAARAKFQALVLAELRRTHPALFDLVEGSTGIVPKARPRRPASTGAPVPDDDVDGLWRREFAP